MVSKQLLYAAQACYFSGLTLSLFVKTRQLAIISPFTTTLAAIIGAYGVMAIVVAIASPVKSGTTLLMGAFVASGCDFIARSLLAPLELPLPAITAFFAAPIVISLLMKKRCCYEDF